MPSRIQRFQYLGIRLAAWLLWLPLTGNPRHGRSWGELKRLQPTQVAAMLVPLACYAAIGAWLYLFFPRELLTWAGFVYGAALFLGGTLVMSTLVTSRVLDLALVYTDR